VVLGKKVMIRKRLDRGAAFNAQLLQGNHFSNAAGISDNVYCFTYPDEYAVTESSSHSRGRAWQW